MSGRKDDAGAGTLNDFVKKLFQMLLEERYREVVRWTVAGDSFVVLDTNEFTKEILPRHFKHLNFASFVRQLNKYDFHKVKISNEQKAHYEYGDDAWEFKHPEFRKDDREALENIRRKAPLKKEAAYDLNPHYDSQILALLLEMLLLREEHKELFAKYKAMLDAVVALRSHNERMQQLLGVMVHCLTQAGIKLPPMDMPTPALVLPRDEKKEHLRLGSFEYTPGLLPQDELSKTTLTVPNPKFHVLLVEDDSVCIQLCRKFLMKYGCLVTVVTDGLNAISTVEHTKYDLVLMDIVMPNLDGATATLVIRLFDTRTPIIAMTGNIQDNDLVTYLQNGMLDILAKPFTKDDLYLILSKHLLKRKDDKMDKLDEKLLGDKLLDPEDKFYDKMPMMDALPLMLDMEPREKKLRLH